MRATNSVDGVGPNDNQVLRELLDEELETDPTTVRGLTNHLPMALVAKHGLGADADELIRFAANYSSRITVLDEPSHRLDERSWRSAIGHYDAAADLREYFVRQVNDEGADETLRTHLPALLPGISGAAFHGVIRLAYAIEVSSPSRIAAGLAYLAETGRPLKELAPGAPTTHDPEEILVGLSEVPAPHVPTGLRTIDEELRFVAQSEHFDASVSSLEIDDGTDERLNGAALRLYASTDDFTALHGVTGLEAISRIRPWVDDQELLSRFAFQALVAAYLSIGAPELWSQDRLEQFVGSDVSDPAHVASTAAYSDDEHVSKLVYTARRSWEKTGDPLYLAIASRRTNPRTS